MIDYNTEVTMKHTILALSLLVPLALTQLGCATIDKKAVADSVAISGELPTNGETIVVYGVVGSDMPGVPPFQTVVVYDKYEKDGCSVKVMKGHSRDFPGLKGKGTYKVTNNASGLRFDEIK